MFFIMESQPPPLTPEEVAALQTVQYAHLAQPQTVKVFGIFHCILAAYGFFGSALALITAFVGNPFLMMLPKTPELAKQMEIQNQMQEKMLPATVISTAFTLIIAALMLIAGIKLLKKRASGLKWSNRYAWASLAGKVLNLILAFAFTFPVMQGMTEGMPGGAASPGISGSIMVASTLAVTLATCIYPILTLILLNRPNTKAWFAAQTE